MCLWFVLGASLGAQDGLPEALKHAVDSKKVVEQLNHLSDFSDAPKPAVTRVVFSEADMEAREYVIKLMEAVGLKVKTGGIDCIRLSKAVTSSSSMEQYQQQKH